MSFLFSLARPVLHALDAETAHGLTVRALKWGFVPDPGPLCHPTLRVRALGLSFPNPVGLAAGFDKNAEVADAMLGLGFGFVEVGSVTPRPQTGNPQPRLFRLAEDEAVINRMGFNNDGKRAVYSRLTGRAGRGGIVGVNLGANKDSADRVADYALGATTFNAIASYLVINVSSPNTPGLRGLQSRAELEVLIGRLDDALTKAHAHDGRRAPLLLKIAPDLAGDELADIAAVCLQGGVDGIVVSNTTLSRPDLRSRARGETGGLSGRPLFRLSTVQLARMYRLTGGRLPLVGVGGIASAEDAWQKLRAGASLVQLYTALLYRGPDLVRDICDGLAQRLAASGSASLADIVGTGAEDWLKS